MKALHYLLALLLLGCLLPWPYAYFQFVRWVAMVGFAVLALTHYERQDTITAILLIGLALLFQPFDKVALGRVGWNVVDVGVGGWLIWLGRGRSFA